MNREESFCVAPGVLIAMPQLQDPNFLRTVVLMIDHNEEGALGLVISRTLPRSCREVSEGLGFSWCGAPEALLRQGGPVDPYSLWLLHDERWSFEETINLGSGLAVSRSREALMQMCQEGAQELLLLVGYAGWASDQLEQEISAGAWLTAPLSREMLFGWPPEQLWAQSLEAMGINPAFLVEGARSLQ